MLVLGIETSCDDTSLCLLEDGQVLSLFHFGQEEILKKWGGVVPEISARFHLEKILPLLKENLAQAKRKADQIDLIGVTTHPGLMGPLLTGLNMAKSLALSFELPIMPVNHLFAHLEAIHLTTPLEGPYLGLLVSGGHTAFFKADPPFDFKVLGSTIDDAAGEALDKAGQLLGLGYPAGRIIDDMAKEGDAQALTFPRGLAQEKELRFSFSGLKTSLRHYLENNSEFNMNDLCASYQEAVVDSLVEKTKILVQKHPGLPLVVGGGVACNSRLREKLKPFKAHFVAPRYCTDNGAMIANYAWRAREQALPFPQCLSLDAASRFIQKKEWIHREPHC